jgi:hypothetical protein
LLCQVTRAISQQVSAADPVVPACARELTKLAAVKLLHL